MLKNLKVEAAVFHVRDLERTAAFYRDVLGIDVTIGEAHDGPYATGNAGGFWLVFFPRDEAPGKSPIIVFSLVDGIHETVEALAAQGVEIVAPVSEAPGGLTADFLDPDGYVLSFYQAVPESQ
jgi:predicted enzyme related to lactoylglutathione lyase